MEGFAEARQRAVDRVTAWSTIAGWTNADLMSDIVNYVGTGYGPNRRLGRQIALDSLEILLEVIVRWSSNPPGVIMRFVAVFDRNPIVVAGSNVLPKWSDVFSGIDYTDGVVESPMQLPNVINAERFIILVDDRFEINGGAALQATGGATYRVCAHNIARRYEVDLSGLDTFFGDSTGVPDIEEGAIYIALVREFVPSAVTLGLVIDGNAHSRVYFDEM